MKPIVNPIFFYLSALCNNIKVTLIMVLIVGLATLAMLLICTGLKYVTKKRCKIIVTLFIILWVGIIAVPSDTVCYQMLAASYVTPNNIEKVLSKGKSLTDYIIDSAKELQDKNETEEKE